MCFCVNYLRKMHLRHYSAPFDWIAGGTFAERINFLLGGFKDFFEKDDLQFYGRRNCPEPCDINYNKRTLMVFNHDFPLYKNIAESFPPVKEKYNRRIYLIQKYSGRRKSIAGIYGTG